MTFRPAYVSVPLGFLMAGFGVYLASVARPGTLVSGPTHPVTAEMLAQADRKSLKPAFEFRLSEPLTGKVYDAKALYPQRPTLVLFIKEGCPCSIEAQPIFNTLATAYAGKINFIGITDAIPAITKLYAKDNATPFPVLSDPKLTAMRAFGAPRSVYFGLVNLDGRIDRFWAGYNKEAMVELNDRIARLAGEEPATLDLKHVPEKPTSGCSFEGM